ncbi:MAG: hypothetical protein B5M46_05375 [Epsilonproteobacteria bacterium 4484_20]|nr:MAG: hypothetical protein B5M46_05375 [Epsilonproteobacteria bacterium 4484_20]
MDFSSLETWGYLAVAFFSFGGSLFIVAAAGVFSYMGHMDLTTALLVAMVANFMGDNFLFYLGKYHKKDIQPYFAKHKRKIALATLILRRYGVLAIFIQKFLYGVKTYYASETIIALFTYIQAKPWIAPLAMVTVLGTLWFVVSRMTKRKEK